MKIWQKDEETIELSELKQLQLERLQTTLNRASENVDFYNKKFKELNIDVNKVKSLDDIKHLPFTVKQDLRDNYPYGLFAVPLKDIVRIHSSSGMTGKPTVVGYTKRDLRTWKDLVARIMMAGGVDEHDIVHIAFSYGLFTGGFGLHYGAEHIGASVIPVSSGNTKRQIMIMQDYRSSVLVCTPSYALHIAETLETMGLTSHDLHLKVGLLGSEPWGEKIRTEVEHRLGIVATDNYGLSEIIGPGVSGECLEKNGLHINEDHFYVEIINPDTGEVLPEGEKGELVITTLTKEAMPLIRYRTRDITRLYRDNCPCGRTFIKMEKPSGRTDDMIIVNGVNVFPTQIEEVFAGFEHATPHYMIFVKKKGHLDMMEIQLEVSEHIFFDEMKKQRAWLEQITEKMYNVLGIKPKIKLVEPKTIERFEGKAKRVIDERKM
jgi:phenylacetate-CoA ligase